MATKLGLYNRALVSNLGLRKLSGLTEAVEPRRVLDTAYDSFLDAVLEQGNWKFALRTVNLDYDPDVTPGFGHNRAFSKPSDYIRLYVLATDEFCNTPLLDMDEDGSYFYASVDEVFLRYVSNDASYGGDLTKWPEAFSKYAASWLANEVVLRLSPESKDNVQREMDKNLKDALAKDCLAMPTRFMRQGSWTTARSTNTKGAYRYKTGGFIIG